MYCKNCGAEIDPGATFCPSCGFDQRPSGSAYTSPGPGSQQGSSWTFTDSSSPELEKKSMIIDFFSSSGDEESVKVHDEPCWLPGPGDV